MRIFNRIRQKLLIDLKIQSYFIYALGEVVLIVVGILIAVQINNWNEEKKKMRMEQVVLLNLREYTLANREQINFSLATIKKNKDNLILRILHTGPNVKLPKKSILDSLAHITTEILVLSYDGTSRLLSQNQLSLIRDKELKTELSTFTLASERYKNLEKNVFDLTIDLRQIHQKYISILNQEITSGRKDALSTSQEQFPSDYVSWLRDRDHQNKAVESKWLLENSIVELRNLKAHNQKILDILEEKI